MRFAPATRQHRLVRLLVGAAGGEGGGDKEDLASLKDKFLPDQKQPQGSSSGGQPEQQQPPQQGSSSEGQKPQQGGSRSKGQKGKAQPQLDTVNPYSLGRSARRAFDEVWSQVANLTSPTKSFVIDDAMEPSRDVEFAAPQSRYTTVLVVGATGRVGRILVRKLLLRGYKVKALVRRREGKQRDELQAIPSAVEIVEGDVGDVDSCQQAVRGVSKIIFCAAARTIVTSDLLRVDDRGVMNLAKAMQDEFVRREYRKRLQAAADVNREVASRDQRTLRRLFSSKSKLEVADFSQLYHQQRWDITFVGTPEDVMRAKEGRPADKWSAVSKAEAEINEEDNLVFSGSLIQRNAFAEMGAPIEAKLPSGGSRMANTEALTLRVRGDGNVYTCVLSTGDGRYYARFPTRQGAYASIRLPYNSFRAAQPGLPPLDPEAVSHIAIRFEARRPPAVVAARAARGLPIDGLPGSSSSSTSSSSSSSLIKFELEVDWIKALPGGEEPDFVLVSCAGRSARPGLGELDVERMVRSKRHGEEHLRMSGLGYTVVRPGLLVDEPGGYRALVFDQSDRISQPISAADVADICLRALHEEGARNKTFDVCYEAGGSGDGSSLFELVVSAPDKSNYLGRATKTLVKNT